jgi:excisionase family DNA binding protein
MSEAASRQPPTTLPRADLVVPSASDAEQARNSSRLLAAIVGKGDAARLVLHGDHEEPLSIPVPALRMLVEILSQMAQGNAVSIVPYHAELTTQEAADFLNVSRPFLVRLLETGQIPFRKVGTHRRVGFSELLKYRERTMTETRQAAAELTALSQELGLGY